MSDPVERQVLPDRSASPLGSLHEDKAEIRRLRAENDRLGKERTIYFMALERIRERTRQDKPEIGARGMAFNESRRALEQGFEIRAAAMRESALPADEQLLAKETE